MHCCFQASNTSGVQLLTLLERLPGLEIRESWFLSHVHHQSGRTLGNSLPFSFLQGVVESCPRRVLWGMWECFLNSKIYLSIRPQCTGHGFWLHHSFALTSSCSLSYQSERQDPYNALFNLPHPLHPLTLSHTTLPFAGATPAILTSSMFFDHNHSYLRSLYTCWSSPRNALHLDLYGLRSYFSDAFQNCNKLGAILDYWVP